MVSTTDAGLAAALGMGIPFMLYWLCCGSVWWYSQRFLVTEEDALRYETDDIDADFSEYSYASDYSYEDDEFDDAETIVIFRPPERTRLPNGPRNLFIVVVVAVEALQLVSYAQPPNLHLGEKCMAPPPTWTSWFFNVVFLDWHDKVTDILSFWVLFSISVLYAMMLIALFAGVMLDIDWLNDLKDAAIDLPRSSKLRLLGELLVFELPPLMYLPFCDNMFQWLSCTYEPGHIFLDRDCSITCWEGTHLVYAILALLALVIFYPTTLLVTAGTLVREIDVKNRASFMILSIQVKYLLAALYTFFSGEKWVWVIMSMITVCFLVLLVANIRLMPCNVWTVNLWRGTTYAMCLWAAVCSMIGMAIGPGDTSSAVSFTLTFFGFLFALGYAGYRHWRRVRDGGDEMEARESKLAQMSAERSERSRRPGRSMRSSRAPRGGDGKKGQGLREELL